MLYLFVFDKEIQGSVTCMTSKLHDKEHATSDIPEHTSLTVSDSWKRGRIIIGICICHHPSSTEAFLHLKPHKNLTETL